MKTFAKNTARAALLSLALVTAACSSTEYPPQVSAIDYRNFQSIRFNAARIDVVSDYQPRGSAPNIDHLMDTSPSQAVNDWARNNLRAGGTSGYVQVRIKDASVISRELPRITGIQGHFTKQQAEELVAHLSVEITGDQQDLRFNGYTSVEASQLITIPDESTVAQRKAIEAQLMNRLMTDFINKAQAGILAHLNPMVMP